eukprot:UN10038
MYLWHTPILLIILVTQYPDPANDLIYKQQFYMFVLKTFMMLLPISYILTYYIEDPIRKKICIWWRNTNNYNNSNNLNISLKDNNSNNNNNNNTLLLSSSTKDTIEAINKTST